MKAARNDPAFLLYYARVLTREARARRGTPFAISLLEWAAKARREACAQLAKERQHSRAQLELFAA